ncbi:MAG: trimeric intracellular cation channel family protein [Pseudomonadota bacterium]|nr:trimeric intracellular cation channel family protein [Pseudomonadota bacterium]
MLQSVLDLVGVFAFALSGGARGVECRLDPFGVVFLAFVAATTGGVMRDLLIGATPPYAITHWHYLAASTVAGLSCYFAYGWIQRLRKPVALFDAIGLGLSAAVGAHKALLFGLTPLMAALLGMLSAIGGGMARDILTTRTPMVLHKEVYAVAALAGAALVAFADTVGAPENVSALLGAGLAISIRLIAMAKDWHLPRARMAADE